MTIPVFTGRRRRLFAGLVGLGLTQAVGATLMAWLVRRLFDAGGHAVGAGPLDIAAFVALAAGLGGLIGLQRGVEEALGQDYASELRLALFDDAISAPDAVASGGARDARRLLPFLGDLTAQRRWVGAGLGRLTVGAATTVALLILIAWLQPALAAAVALALALGVAATVSLATPLRRSNEGLRRRRAALASFVGDRLAAATAIRIMGGLPVERRKLARRADLLVRQALERAVLAGGARGVAAATGSMMLLALLLTGAAEVRSGAMTAGAVLGALGQIGLMTAAVSDLAQAFELWQASQAASASVRRRLARSEAERPRPKRRRRGMTLLSLDRVRLDAASPAFDAEADVCDVVLVSGGSAARLTALLSGIARPAAGCIRLRGRDVVGLGDGDRRRLIGVAGPSLGLLQGSLGMNLRYRAGAATGEELEQVIGICGLAPLIARLDGGLAGDVGPGGVHLTAAERDAVLIARAMLGRPPLLVLDGVDGRLPKGAARAIADVLSSWPGVVVLAAERPDWRALANRGWSIRRGRLRDAGARISPTPFDQESEPCLS